MALLSRSPLILKIEFSIFSVLDPPSQSSHLKIHSAPHDRLFNTVL